MFNPWLSIVIPTYNGAEHVSDALLAICDQCESELEVIIVDDGSTDQTLAVVNSFQTRLCLRVLVVEHTGNWVANANLGLSRAEGKYVAVLHQDDRWCSGRQIAVRRALTENPASVLLFHSVFFIDTIGKRIGRWDGPFSTTKELVLRSDTFVERLLVQNFVACCAAVIRKDTLEAAGMLDEHLWFAADWDLWLTIGSLGTAIYIPEPLAECRIHSRSQTITRLGASDEIKQQLEFVFSRHWCRFASHLSSRDRRQLEKVGRFSIELNVALARIANSNRLNQGYRLIWKFIALGIGGWYRYFRDSRIVQRIRARLRAQRSKIWY